MQWLRIKLRTAGVITAMALLCGCAAPQITPLSRGDALVIVVAMSPQADGAVKINNDALASGVSAGGGSGMAVGGLWGLSCGPFAVLCVPLGMLAGGLTGSAAGAVVGVTGALPEPKSALLLERVAQVQQSHALLAELQKNLADRAQRHWRLAPSAPATVLTVELQELALTSTRDERIRCIVRVLVTVQPQGIKKAAVPKLYEFVGPYGKLAAWLDESSDFVDTSLTSASQQIAAQIVADLAAN